MPIYEDVSSSDSDVGESQDAPVEDVSEDVSESTGAESDSADGERTRDTPDRTIKNLNAALRQERAQRRSERDRAEHLESTFQRFLDVQNRQSEPLPPQIPDPAEDLGGNLYVRQHMLEQQLRDQQRYAYQSQQAQQAQQEKERVLSTYRAEASRFAKVQPDFEHAYQALVTDRLAELETMGYDAETARQLAYNDEMMIVHQALSEGVNPASRVYAVAKRRGLTNADPDNAHIKMDAASRSSAMGSMRGGSPRGKLTLEQLSRLDGDEFLKAWDKVMKK